MTLCTTSYQSYRRLRTRLGFLVGVLFAVLFDTSPFPGLKTIGFGFAGEASFRQLDLARPDVMIKTNSLAKLPRDLLQVPLFKELLSEDFVFYYEQNEGRLSLSGTFRRLAYEHDLDVGDWLTRMVIDEPAEVLLWKGSNGRLQHYRTRVTH
jgi:uncharacterized protein YfaA (DUF2138 family)